MNTTSTDTVYLDGSAGGGQILRSSLTLSIVTGRTLVLENVRTKRERPGLMRQHLTAVNAAKLICGAEVEGAELGSTSIRFVPSKTQGGRYSFAIGTAGSTMLVLQTVLLPLCFADDPSEVTISGGTHNTMCPPFEFIDQVYLPILRELGVEAQLELIRPGFYPAGGGEVKVVIQPIKALQPTQKTSSEDGYWALIERGELVELQATAIVNNLARSIAERELEVIQKRLKLSEDQMTVVSGQEAPGPGNVCQVLVRHEHADELFVSHGKPGLSGKTVANKLCDEAYAYLRSGAPVGKYLADQLLLPLALAGGGTFQCTELTDHFHTHKAVLESFLPISVETKPHDNNTHLVTLTTQTS